MRPSHAASRRHHALRETLIYGIGGHRAHSPATVAPCGELDPAGTLTPRQVTLLNTHHAALSYNFLCDD
jgi:hypothetical protein